MNVYVLSNPAMPGIVKIGRAIVVESRVEDLSRPTGVPLPFQIEHVELVEDEVGVEYLAHASLAPHRINPRREFFAVPVGTAIEAIQAAALMNAWNKAGQDARDEFLSRIELTVFGRQAGAA